MTWFPSTPGSYSPAMLKFILLSRWASLHSTPKPPYAAQSEIPSSCLLLLKNAYASSRCYWNLPGGVRQSWLFTGSVVFGYGCHVMIGNVHVDVFRFSSRVAGKEYLVEWMSVQINTHLERLFSTVESNRSTILPPYPLALILCIPS